MRIKKPSKQKGRYMPLADMKEIDDAFLGEMKRIKADLDILKDKDVTDTFFHVILDAYTAAVEFKILEREVDKEIKLAEIEERRRNLKPWRRCWLWRLIFQPLTNRAQDIIEARAELDADIKHTADENAIKDDRKKLPADKGRQPSKRERKRIMRDKLKAIINAADNADVQEAFNEPKQGETQEKPEPAPTEPKATPAPQGNGQLPGQLTLDDVQAMARRPRPPRSCRKP